MKFYFCDTCRDSGVVKKKPCPNCNGKPMSLWTKPKASSPPKSKLLPLPSKK